MNLWLLPLIIVILISVSYIVYKFTHNWHSLKSSSAKLLEAYKELSNNLNDMESENTALLTELNKVVHQKKSSEVRLGKIGENLAPFMDGWPWDSNNFRFIGNPIDGIQFTEDEIIFVEIKTGKSRLSKGQILCKDLIEKGKVRFVSFRIGEKGITVE